jgi:DNA-binding SARP family transcriptional activator/WD40 repeat protein
VGGVIRVFGPAGVDGDGVLAGRDRQVLAALVVTRRQQCPAERVAAAVYGEAEPPPTWRKVVQGSIVRLRRVLGRRAIETTADGYQLVVGDDQIDVGRFEWLVTRGRELLEAGEPAQAVAVLEEALGLAGGDPLCDLDGWDPGRAEASRLGELRAFAEEQWIEALLASGRHREAVSAAAALAEAEPLREQRWVALALAQYRAGRQGEALRSIGRARRVLVEELGVDPGRELVDLEAAILNQDQSLALPDADAVSEVCPYRGLAGYEFADAGTFFGREAAIEECLDRVARCGFVAVVGPSGGGKSSLARAGIAPGLARGGGGVAIVTPGPHPVAALAAAPRGVALVVDQLEELFTQCADPAERRAFVAALDARAVTEAIVVTLRSDHLASTAALPALADRIEEGLYLLRPMTAEDLRAAIEGPARRAGLHLEAGLVELLVSDVADRPGALPLLSHVMTEIWARRQGPVLTAAAYRSAGGLHGAVSQTAERAMRTLPPEGQRIARELLLRLVAVTDGAPVRHRLPLHDLAVDTPHADVLDTLFGARLVTIDHTTVQVAHEALAVAWPRLRSWLDEDQEGQRILQHLAASAAAWAALDRDPGELYRGGRLRQTQEWVEANHPTLTPSEHTFLDASLAARRAHELDLAARADEEARANRRLRRAVLGIAAGLAVALVAATVAVVQRDRAKTAQAVSEQSAAQLALRGAVAQSEALRSTKPDLAALLAVAAHGIEEGPETFSALLGTFTERPSYLRTIRLDRSDPSFGSDSDINHVGVVLADDATFAVTDRHQGVRFVDLASGTEVGSLPAVAPGEAQQPQGYLAVSPDGRHLAQATSRGGAGVLVMWDLRTSDRRFEDVPLEFAPGSVAFSPDASLVAVSGGDRGITEVRDAGDGSRVRRVPGLDPPSDSPTAGPMNRTAALAFLDDGSLAVASRSGIVRIVEPRTGAELRRLTGPADISDMTLAVGPERRRLFGSSANGTIAWDLDTGDRLWTREGTERCRSLAAPARLAELLCGRDDGGVEVFDLDSGTTLERRFDYRQGPVEALQLAQDGRVLVQTGGPSIAVWRLDGGGAVSRTVDGTAGLVPMGFGGDGLLLVREPSPPGTPVSDTALVDVRSSRLADPLDGLLYAQWDRPPVAGLLGALFADGTMGPYDTATRTRVPDRSIDVGGLPAIPTTGATRVGEARLVLSDDEQFFAVDDSGAVGPPMGRAEWIWGLGSTRDGSRLFTHETPGRLVPRDPVTGEPNGPAIDDAYAYTIASDRIVVGGWNGRLRLLDTRTLEPVGATLPPVAGKVNALAITDDASRLLVTGEDRRAQLIDATDGAYLGGPISLDIGANPFRGRRGGAQGAISPDGSLLALPTSGGVAIWDLDPDRLVAAACDVVGRDLTEQEWAEHLAALGDHRQVCRAP